MLVFNKPCYTGNEDDYVIEAMRSGHMSGDGKFGHKCQSWFEEKLGCPRALLTPSCTHALEMAAILIDTRPGDEVIMPSYTFVSTANAFALRGATIVFVDICANTMNIDPKAVESAITDRTKAIVPVHYAGVSCDMDRLMCIARDAGIYVIEDAAQAMMSTFRGRPLGSIGDLGTYSFHETKGYTSGGEGGLLIVNDDALVERAEIIREKGTDRSRFFRGLSDKYTWVDVGSSYLPSEIQAAYLWAQLEQVQHILETRQHAWRVYYELLNDSRITCHLELPNIDNVSEHNAHMFQVKAQDIHERTALIKHLSREGISAVFHYIPLHSSVAGRRFGRFYGADENTTRESERVLRLPLFHGITLAEQQAVVQSIREFYR